MAAQSDLEICSLIYNYFLGKDKHLAGAIKSKYSAVSFLIMIDFYICSDPADKANILFKLFTFG